jgi:hypothetical protein
MLKAAIMRSFVILGLGLLLGGVAACRSVTRATTLPDPFEIRDDVQYFPAGTEFKFSREAAAMQAANAETMPPDELLSSVPPANHVMLDSPPKRSSGIK